MLSSSGGFDPRKRVTLTAWPDMSMAKLQRSAVQVQNEERAQHDEWAALIAKHECINDSVVCIETHMKVVLDRWLHRGGEKEA